MDPAAVRAFHGFAAARPPALLRFGHLLTGIPPRPRIWCRTRWHSVTYSELSEAEIATRGTLTCVDPRTAQVRGVRSFDDTGLLMADAVGPYAVTRSGLVQLAPASVCHG